MGAGVAVGLFVGLSVFICYLELRIIGLVRLRTGRVRVPCEGMRDGDDVEPHLRSEGRLWAKERSTLNLSPPFVRFFP